MARVDVNKTCDNVKHLTLNCVETGMDVGGVVPMYVGNIEEGGTLEIFEVFVRQWQEQFPRRMHPLRRVWAQGRAVSETLDFLDVRWVSRVLQEQKQGKEHWQGPVRAVLHQQRAPRQGLGQEGWKGVWPEHSQQKNAKGPTHTVMEKEDVIQWSGDVEADGEGALALLNLTDRLAGHGSTIFFSPPTNLR